MTQAVLPKVRGAKGRIVFISSVSGLITMPGDGAYCASKYALESLPHALRIELRPWRIAVSLVDSGPISTDIWRDIPVDQDRVMARPADQHRAVYTPQLNGARNLLARIQKTAADPEKVVRAVDHALTACRPRAAICSTRPAV